MTFFAHMLVIGQIFAGAATIFWLVTRLFLGGRDSHVTAIWRARAVPVFLLGVLLVIIATIGCDLLGCRPPGQ